MKQLAGSIRIGWVIEYKGKPWTITKASHIKPGKGGAFMQVEMKSVEEGTKTNFKDVAGLTEEKEEVKELIDFLKKVPIISENGEEIDDSLINSYIKENINYLFFHLPIPLKNR